MQKFITAWLIVVVLLIVQSNPTLALEKPNKDPIPQEDISDILNQKLNEYDKTRRTFKTGNSNFSLKYNKNYGKVPQTSDGVERPMVEQQKRLKNFESLNEGPTKGARNYYGFSMSFPWESKK